MESSAAGINRCPFFHNSPPNCTFGYNLLNPGQVLRNLHPSGSEQTDSHEVFLFFSLLFFFVFFLSSLGKNTSPPMVLSAAALTSPQVALCGCGVEDLAGVPISASLHKQTDKNMPNASRTRCKDTDKIITRTVTDITATRNCQRFFFFLFFFFWKIRHFSPQTGYSSRPVPPLGLELGVLLPLPKSSQWTN